MYNLSVADPKESDAICQKYTDRVSPVCRNGNVSYGRRPPETRMLLSRRTVFCEIAAIASRSTAGDRKQSYKDRTFSGNKIKRVTTLNNFWKKEAPALLKQGMLPLSIHCNLHLNKTNVRLPGEGI